MFPVPLEEYENLSIKERLKRIDEALDWIIIALYSVFDDKREIAAFNKKGFVRFFEKRMKNYERIDKEK